MRGKGKIKGAYKWLRNARIQNFFKKKGETSAKGIENNDIR
jgi:hypothetical protein